jgi:hypothetical protein
MTLCLNDEVPNDEITNDEITNDEITNDEIMNDEITNEQIDGMHKKPDIGLPSRTRIRQGTSTWLICITRTNTTMLHDIRTITRSLEIITQTQETPIIIRVVMNLVGRLDIRRIRLLFINIPITVRAIHISTTHPLQPLKFQGDIVRLAAKTSRLIKTLLLAKNMMTDITNIRFARIQTLAMELDTRTT